MLGECDSPLIFDAIVRKEVAFTMPRLVTRLRPCSSRVGRWRRSRVRVPAYSLTLIFDRLAGLGGVGRHYW